jgi:hypothetical protein
MKHFLRKRQQDCSLRSFYDISENQGNQMTSGPGPLQICKTREKLEHWYHKAMGFIIKQESQKLYTQMCVQSFKTVLHLF